MKSQIKGVIYDLDGTSIDTEALHEEAWKSAAYSAGVVMTRRMLLDQKGRSGREFVEETFGWHPYLDIDLFLSIKSEYTREHLSEISFCPGFLEAQEMLKNAGIPVWICTAAKKDFFDQCSLILPELEDFQLRVVTSDLYARGKPSSEPLETTQFLMGNFPSEELVYVGDARSDYLAAKAANMRFIYFCAKGSRRDIRIPEDVPVIQNHKEILELIG